MNHKAYFGRFSTYRALVKGTWYSVLYKTEQFWVLSEESNLRDLLNKNGYCVLDQQYSEGYKEVFSKPLTAIRNWVANKVLNNLSWERRCQIGDFLARYKRPTMCFMHPDTVPFFSGFIMAGNSYDDGFVFPTGHNNPSQYACDEANAQVYLVGDFSSVRPMFYNKWSYKAEGPDGEYDVIPTKEVNDAQMLKVILGHLGCKELKIVLSKPEKVLHNEQ